MSRAELSEWCIGFVADLLERAPAKIDPETRFSRLGFDSAMAVQLVVALEERLGLELSPDTIAEHPSIAQLSAYLAGRTL